MTDPVRDIIPARSGESDQERRMRETINRLAGQMIGALDAAIALRTAPGAAAKARHVARGHLTDFALHAMQAVALSESHASKGESHGEA